MALSGMHIACGYAGNVVNKQQGLSLMGPLVWSQTMAAPGTTNEAAPQVSGGSGYPVFQLRASADSYAAISSNPDATSGPRIFVPANETVTIYAKPADKVAWIVVP